MNPILTNDDGVAFGMWIFLALIFVSVLTYSMLLPLYNEAGTAFDDEYRDEYLTTEGKNSARFMETMFEHGAFIFIMFAGVVMVINRAIYKGQ